MTAVNEHLGYGPNVAAEPGEDVFVLAKTDEPAANAKAYVDLLDDQKKTILADEYMKAEGSQGDRNKVAESSEAYKAHIKKLHDARYDWELCRNRRKSAELRVEVWRSQNANMRRGNI